MLNHRAVLKANSDKISYIEQHVASGFFNNSHKEAFENMFPTNQ